MTGRRAVAPRCYATQIAVLTTEARVTSVNSYDLLATEMLQECPVSPVCSVQFISFFKLLFRVSSNLNTINELQFLCAAHVTIRLRNNVVLRQLLLKISADNRPPLIFVRLQPKGNIQLRHMLPA